MKAGRVALLHFFRVAWPVHFFESGTTSMYRVDRSVLDRVEELSPGQNPYLGQVIHLFEGHGSIAVPRTLSQVALKQN